MIVDENGTFVDFDGIEPNDDVVDTYDFSDTIEIPKIKEDNNDE